VLRKANDARPEDVLLCDLRRLSNFELHNFFATIVIVTFPIRQGTVFVSLYLYQNLNTMDVIGLPPGQVRLLAWDENRVMRVASSGSAASTADTRFDKQLGKWDVQIVEMEPANMDFLFNTIASQDVAKAARLYAIAHDMHVDYQRKYPNPRKNVFDIDAVQIDVLENALNKLDAKTQTTILALHKEYIRRDNFKEIIPLSAVRLNGRGVK